MQKEWFKFYATAHIDIVQTLGICLFYDAV